MRKLLIVLILGVLLSACAGKSDPFANYRHLTATQLLQDGEKQLAKEHYLDATKTFEALDALYPFGPTARQGQIDIIYAYYMNDDFVLAETAAERFLHLYPQDPHADYALYMKAIINFEQGLTWLQRVVGIDPSTRDITHLQEAFKDLSLLARTYPHSLCRDDALRRMAYIRNAIARENLAIANYYFQRRAYVAAINRANDIVLHFEGAPSVPKALRLIVDSYQQMDLPKMAAKYQTILHQSYPGQ